MAFERVAAAVEKLMLAFVCLLFMVTSASMLMDGKWTNALISMSVCGYFAFGEGGRSRVAKVQSAIQENTSSHGCAPSYA